MEAAEEKTNQSSDRSSSLNWKERLRIYFLSRLGTFIMRFIHFSIRWEEIGVPNNWVDGEPLITAFWHNRQLMMAWPFIKHKARHSTRKMYVLISEHSDGRIIAEIMRCVGIDSVAGSSSHRGTAALKGLINCIKEGNHVTFTPDGPRGPIYKAKSGILSLAMLTGAPVVPTVFACEKYWEIHSWDKMIVPKPFTRGVYIMGKPLRFPRDLKGDAFNAALKQIEDALMEVTNKADTYFSK